MNSSRQQRHRLAASYEYLHLKSDWWLIDMSYSGVLLLCRLLLIILIRLKHVNCARVWYHRSLITQDCYFIFLYNNKFSLFCLGLLLIIGFQLQSTDTAWLYPIQWIIQWICKTSDGWSSGWIGQRNSVD